MPVTSLLMSSLGSGGGTGQGVANLGSGLIGGLVGLFQRKKANKLLKNLSRPNYAVPSDVLRNQEMAQIAANQGMPSQQYNNAMKNIQRNQASTLSASLDRRSALMALPKILRSSNDATANLDAQDAMMQRENQRILYGVNSDVAKYKDKAWEINKMQPYQRDYSYAMGLLGAGNQNLMSGLDKLVAGGGQLIGGASGGSKKKYSYGGGSGEPTYYNGYDSNSQYGGFENGY